MTINTIYNEDCLTLLQRMPNNTINLIYIDPPFNCKRDQEFGMPPWKDNNQEPNRIDEILPIIPNDTGTRNYLRFMYSRIKEMHRVLRCDGSIYVHCDWRVNSYLRLLLDEVFGRDNFRNEIAWRYRTGNVSEKQFQRKHDSILLYSKGKSWNFYPIEIKEYYSQIYGPTFKASFKGRNHGEDQYGEFRLSFLDDVWDVSAVFTLSNEHLKYPTQKPEKMLENVIKASSNPGDLVADFFCGSGTTLAVAEKLGRKWIGCDSNKVAVDIATERINKIDKGLFNETNSRR